MATSTFSRGPRSSSALRTASSASSGHRTVLAIARCSRLALTAAAYSTLLPELRQLDLEAVAPAADLHRRLTQRAADGADVAAVFAEKLDQELTQRLLFGQRGRDRGARLVRADGFGEVLEVDPPVSVRAAAVSNACSSSRMLRGQA